MGKKKVGHAKPGATVTRRVTRGPGKGDTVRFKANSASAQRPGKLNPKGVIVDRGQKGTQKTVPKAKKKSGRRR